MDTLGNENRAAAGQFSVELPFWAKELVYSRSFKQEQSLILEEVNRWRPFCGERELDLSQVEACVAIKNKERNIVFANSAFRYFFAAGNQVVERSTEAFTFWKTAKLSQQTDELILEGTQSIDVEHVGRDAEGRGYTFRTYKCSLAEWTNPNYFILGVSRPIALLGNSEHEQSKKLSELHALFVSLDAVDQTICRLDAQGELTKDIAASVGLTSRSIENRRKKLLGLFRVERFMEIIRITIRLEEHGLLPPNES